MTNSPVARPGRRDDCSETFEKSNTIGVAEGSDIADKKMYQVQFAFAPGQTGQAFSDRVESFTFKPSPDKHSTDYEFLAGLQLTQDQLDYNRKIGRYVQ